MIFLMYHDIYRREPEESGFISKGANYYKLPVSLFEEHLSKLMSYALETGIEVKDIVFTFDDGGSSAMLVSSVLDKFVVKGHFFIATDRINTKGFLTEDQIRDMVSRGHFVGSHSCSHPENILELTKDERKREWEISIKRLNDIIVSQIAEISCPNGYYCKEDLDLFRSLGISKVYTSKFGQYKNYGDIDIIGRVSITSTTPSQQLIKMISSPTKKLEIRFRQSCLSIAKIAFGENYMRIKRSIRNWQG